MALFYIIKEIRLFKELKASYWHISKELNEEADALAELRAKGRIFWFLTNNKKERSH